MAGKGGMGNIVEVCKIKPCIGNCLGNAVDILGIHDEPAVFNSLGCTAFESHYFRLIELQSVSYCRIPNSISGKIKGFFAITFKHYTHSVATGYDCAMAGRSLGEFCPAKCHANFSQHSYFTESGFSEDFGIYLRVCPEFVIKSWKKK